MRGIMTKKKIKKKKKPKTKMRTIRPPNLTRYGLKISHCEGDRFSIELNYSKLMGPTEARVLIFWLQRYVNFKEQVINK